MRALRDVQIKYKLMIIMMITSSVAVLIMAIAMVINQAVKESRAIADQLETLAQIIGSRSTGALAFDDRRTAEENLHALSAKSNIVYAVIHKANASMFAEYRPARGQPDTSSFSIFMDTIEVAMDVVLDGERVGRIRIVSNMDEFYATLIDQVMWALLIMVACFTISFLISSRLHKVVSAPIMRLRNAMDSVSTDQDYSVRAEKHADDELGVLIDGFNQMLQQIEGRDADLARYRAGLEAEVTVRTNELEQATRKRISWLQTLARFLRHELKNATVGIRTSLELIDRRTQDRSIDVYVYRGRKSIDFMNAVLENVGNASSLEASIYQDVRGRMDLSGLVTACLEEYRLSYSEHEFVVRCSPGITMLGKDDRVRQMLGNLISNAIEHSKPGTPVIVSLERHDDHAGLSVSNEGPKLAADKDSLFDLYVSMRDPKYQGQEHLGLGLYIVKLVAESHGGQVQARDLEGKEGVIFTVTLPTL